jgi:hypothetical protein
MGCSKSKEAKSSYVFAKQAIADGPSQRFDCVFVRHDNSFFMMGGAAIGWEMKNDLWRFDISEEPQCNLLS